MSWVILASPVVFREKLYKTYSKQIAPTSTADAVQPPIPCSHLVPSLLRPAQPLHTDRPNVLQLRDISYQIFQPSIPRMHACQRCTQPAADRWEES